MVRRRLCGCVIDVPDWTILGGCMYILFLFKLGFSGSVTPVKDINLRRPTSAALELRSCEASTTSNSYYVYSTHEEALIHGGTRLHHHLPCHAHPARTAESPT